MDTPRSSGVLLHPTSLPGRYGVGELGEAARCFVDRLAEAGQTWWQILPLNPTDFAGSPYASPSAFAGNALLIDLDALIEEGWLSGDDLAPLLEAIDGEADDEYVVDVVGPAKMALLDLAYERWKDTHDRQAFDAFVDENAYWLDDWALFAALKVENDGKFWIHWAGNLVARKEGTLAQVKMAMQSSIEREKFKQWVFDNQWSALKAYAAKRNIAIIGDIPIFPAMDSADAWANRQYFELDDAGNASVVAGVPPDYFSATGQKWGNPLYDWDALARDDYAWWFDRIKRAMDVSDLVRIDHFRGFESFWAVPAEAPNAIQGEWRVGPGDAFFDAVREHFGRVPFIAEDLGIITEEVTALRDRHDLPGMKVMHFAFDGDPDHPFLPHTYPEVCVAYLGTHDNDTTAGWYASASDEIRHNVRTYLSHGDDGIVDAMMRSLAASRARLVVFTVQDLFGLGAEARMNTPGTSQGNWRWRMTREQLNDDDAWARLGTITRESQR